MELILDFDLQHCKGESHNFSFTNNCDQDWN
ncbi:mCG1026948, isoform CRA_a [Mus musculus]|nr:mCG1026948, isoform CRA_a [Mus musculus]